jgi:hypothetical protein
MGIFFFESAPDVLGADEAAVREGLSTAYSAVAQDQQDVRAFIEAHGADVVAGHPFVRPPGRQGDPDPTLDASD